jgi:hypothetical protein
MAAKRSVPRSRQVGRSAIARLTGLLRGILSPVQVATAQLSPLRSRSQTVTGTAGYCQEAVSCGN